MTNQHYLNEFDQFAARWLRNLSAAGQIPPATVDERSIKDVKAADLVGFRQCHFFAGIGGWPLALRIAGLEHVEGLWTGSCPCQPFSSAGKQKGTSDERHLWPVWFQLIRECQPEYVFGEQVSAAIGHGWLDGVFADMEGAGYTGGAVVLGAHSVGAPHIRQRVFWGFKRNGGVSDASGTTSEWNSRRLPSTQAGISGSRELNGNHAVGPEHGCTDIHGVSDANTERSGVGLLNTNCDRCESWQSPASPNGHGNPADATGSGLRNSTSDDEQRTRQFVSIIGGEAGWLGADSQRSVAASDPWSDYTIGTFRDGKSRRIGRGVQPLAYGVPRSMGQGQPELRKLCRSASQNRVGRLKGYGNAIVPWIAAVLLTAFMESFEWVTKTRFIYGWEG